MDQNPKIAEAVEKTTKFLDELTDPSSMSQQEVRDFYDSLWDSIEERYAKICSDLGE